MKLYYLSIPIIIGIIAGGFLVGYGMNSNDSEILTSEKLIKMVLQLWAILMLQLQY